MGLVLLIEIRSSEVALGVKVRIESDNLENQLQSNRTTKDKVRPKRDIGF